MKKAIRILIALALLSSVIFANFYAVRRMLRCGTKVYFYDKLLVAFDAAGMRGLEAELQKISLNDKIRLEQALVG